VSAPSRADILRPLFGFMVTQAISVMARLGVPDALAAGPRTADELAADLGADADALGRFLRALASLGIFTETRDGRYANSPLSDLLRSDVEGSARWIAQSFGAEHYRVWSDALHTVLSGEPASPRVLGREYFDWLGDHEAEAQNFNHAMAAASEVRVQPLLERDWDDELVVDVGGGTGRLLTTLLARHPRLRGIVVDLPHSEDEARATIAGAGVADRCDFVAGSFFDTVPPGGDVYVLAHILHDWSDERALEILRMCRRAAAPGTRLLLLEGVVPDGPEPHPAKILDLHMLVLLGGRERTEREWRSLLAEGGFELAAVRPDPRQTVIEAVAVASPAETD